MHVRLVSTQETVVRIDYTVRRDRCVCRIRKWQRLQP